MLCDPVRCGILEVRGEVPSIGGWDDRSNFNSRAVATGGGGIL